MLTATASEEIATGAAGFRVHFMRHSSLLKFSPDRRRPFSSQGSAALDRLQGRVETCVVDWASLRFSAA